MFPYYLRDGVKLQFNEPSNGVIVAASIKILLTSIPLFKMMRLLDCFYKLQVYGKIQWHRLVCLIRFVKLGIITQCAILFLTIVSRFKITLFPDFVHNRQLMNVNKLDVAQTCPVAKVLRY